MITCHVRYEIDADEIEAFERFGQRWMELVEQHGGIHHGYFLPAEGASDVAYAAFSFPSLAEYERYRERSRHRAAALREMERSVRHRLAVRLVHQWSLERSGSAETGWVADRAEPVGGRHPAQRPPRVLRHGDLQDAGRSAAGPVHWPEWPAPLPPLVGGEGVATAAGASAPSSAHVDSAIAILLRSGLIQTSWV